VLRMHAPTAELADHHDEEAGEMAGLIDEIETADPDTWQMLYDELVDSVSFHAAGVLSRCTGQGRSAAPRWTGAAYVVVMAGGQATLGKVDRRCWR